MRTHVTFQADFSKQAGPAAPAGRDLAGYLAAQLQAVGFSAGTPAAYEGYAYRFACGRAQHTVLVFVALVDDGVQEWLVYAEPQVGVVGRWLQRLGFRRARRADAPLLQAVCTAIHQCVHATARFRSERWYTPDNWDTNPDSGWSTAP